MMTGADGPDDDDLDLSSEVRVPNLMYTFQGRENPAHPDHMSFLNELAEYAASDPMTHREIQVGNREKELDRREAALCLTYPYTLQELCRIRRQHHTWEQVHLQHLYENIQRFRERDFNSTKDPAALRRREEALAIRVQKVEERQKLIDMREGASGPLRFQTEFVEQSPLPVRIEQSKNKGMKTAEHKYLEYDNTVSVYHKGPINAERKAAMNAAAGFSVPLSDGSSDFMRAISNGPSDEQLQRLAALTLCGGGGDAAAFKPPADSKLKALADSLAL